MAEKFGKMKCKTRGGGKNIPFLGGEGCKTTFCREKGVASVRLGRGLNEPYLFFN